MSAVQRDDARMGSTAIVLRLVCVLDDFVMSFIGCFFVVESSIDGL